MITALPQLFFQTCNDWFRRILLHIINGKIVLIDEKDKQ